MKDFKIETSSRSQMIDVTSRVQKIVSESGIKNGTVTVFIPHTTAGVTINENADPDVVYDMLDIFEKLVPYSRKYRHAEGNSDAHVKSTLVGQSLNVIVDSGQLCLGTWQGIYFCEFDGPRARSVFVQVSS